MPRQRTLHDIFRSVAVDYELDHNLSYDIKTRNHEGYIEIPVDGKTLKARFVFDASQDRYDFVAVIAEIRNSQMGIAVDYFLKSTPLPGIADRIENNRLVIRGARDHLTWIDDIQVYKMIQEDIGIIVGYDSEHGAYY